MKRILLFLTVIGTLTQVGKSVNPNVLDIKECITDSAIIYPESFEADTQRLLEGWYMKNYTATDDRYRTMGDVEVSDEELTKRLAALPTVIEMPFNQVVKSYIHRYTSKSRTQVAAILGLSHYYMPIFEQVLEAHGLPLELKYLPVIESGLDPNAVSKHGASGLWQFLIATGKNFGLEVNSLVDQRRDPYLSSHAAAKYLKDLYQTYNDWSLAIAAYNCGPGNVNKAIRRAGGDPQKQDFWSIYEYLSPETRGYVPMFIAANYVMNYYDKHNIGPVLATKPLITDTVAVSERIHFDQIAKVLDLPKEELRILNPQFRTDLIPASDDKQYYLILPSQQVHAFLLSKEQIVSQDAEKYARREVIEPGNMDEPFNNNEGLTTIAEADVTQEGDVAVANDDTDNSEMATREKTITHKVLAGETLASIAEKYGVTTAQIKEWNSLRRNAVRTGQQLRIVTTEEVSAETVKAEKEAAEKKKLEEQKKKEEQQKKKKDEEKKKKKAKTQTYTVKKGDSLSRIASKYGVTVKALKSENGLSGNTIRPGQKLKIPAKKASEKKAKKRR